MSAFRYDNPFMNIMIRIANLMILSFFWLICCLPVITILPASAAMYHTIVKVVHQQGNGVAKDYFHAFAGSLKKGIPLSLIALGAGALLAYALYVGKQMMERSLAGTFYFVFGLGLAFLLIAAVLHLVPALAAFEGNVGMYLRLGMYFSGKNLLKSLLRLLLLCVVVLLIDFYPVALLILPGVYMDLIAPGLKKMTDQFMADNGLAVETEEPQLPKPQAADPEAAMPSIDLDRALSGAEENRDG